MQTPKPTLTLIYMDGCIHCAEAKPEFWETVRRLGGGIEGRLANIDKVRISFPVPYLPTVLLQLSDRYYTATPDKVPMLATNLTAWVTLCLRDADLKRTRARAAALVAERTGRKP